MIWKYGKAHTIKLYPIILLKLIQLRTLHVMHSSILLDADPAQLKPLPLAIIHYPKEKELSEKEGYKEVVEINPIPQSVEELPSGKCMDNNCKEYFSTSNYDTMHLHQHSSILTPESINSGPHSVINSVDSFNNSDMESQHNSSLPVS